MSCALSSWVLLKLSARSPITLVTLPLLRVGPVPDLSVLKSSPPFQALLLCEHPARMGARQEMKRDWSISVPLCPTWNLVWKR